MLPRKVINGILKLLPYGLYYLEQHDRLIFYDLYLVAVSLGAYVETLDSRSFTLLSQNIFSKFCELKSHPYSQLQLENIRILHRRASQTSNRFGFLSNHLYSSSFNNEQITYLLRRRYCVTRKARISMSGP